jgi:putative ATP-dependent endonuclease of OLD family
MRIRSLKIHNFRSIRDLSMVCEPMQVLLGPNNHGKSNILAALEFALSTAAKLSPEDLFRFAGEDRELWVELTFSGLSEQERSTFRTHLEPDGTFTVRRTARFQDDAKIETAYRGWSRTPKVDFLRSERAGDLTTRAAVEATPLRDLAPGSRSGRLTKAMIEEAQQHYIQAHEAELELERVEGPFMGEKGIANGLLPDFYLIPAARDLSDEAKVKTTTTFGRLLNRAAQEMAAHDPRFQRLREEMSRLVGMLNRKEEGPDERPQQLQELEKVFELGTSTSLDDWVKALVEQQGHGLQRAVIFGLVRAWAKTLRQPLKRGEGLAPRRAPKSLILGLEEPELSLHPHAQRRLRRSLEDIADSDHHQVFVCTHSSHFVDLDRFRSVAIVTKPSPQKGTGLRQCTEELFDGAAGGDRKRRFQMARWVDPGRAEMFFAKRVVFVEGETEASVLPFLAQQLGCFDPEVSVVDCGSKFNLALYIAIANAFKLRYLVIHDEDPVPAQIPQYWTEERIKEATRTFAENGEIARLVDAHLGGVRVVSPRFEQAAGVPKAQGQKEGEALAALDHFEALRPTEIPRDIAELVRDAYKVDEQDKRQTET